MSEKVGQPEIITQNRVIELFQTKLDYTYLGNLKAREVNKNIENEYLEKFLKRNGHSSIVIEKIIHKINNVASKQVGELYDINKEFYAMLRYGANIKEYIGENAEDISIINWKNFLDNDFYIAEEVSIKGENNKRPDIVIYVNGIALAVIEFKRSTVSLNEGIRQNLDNQSNNFIKPFFNTIQLTIAGNDSEGLKYGTTNTSEKYYLNWKEDDKVQDVKAKKLRALQSETNQILDKNIISLFFKERFLEIIHDFIIFDAGIKKLCRPNQYFGVKATQDSIKAKTGGIIWHTQGSGKSLTMTWLAKWIKENNPNSRILIITDRDELDEQIELVFEGVDETIKRAKNGGELLYELNSNTSRLMCSLIHKFGGKKSKEEEVTDKEIDEYIKELEKNIPKDYEAKGDIIVFVDECHRTQSGKLHEAMKKFVPNGLFIGFTGTPLLKKDKKKSIEIFGNYIHTYKFNEAVEDNVILDLRYEARKIEQEITSQKKIDEWFQSKTKGLTEYAANKLKEKWGTMQNLLSSKSRLETITNDIVFDMEVKPRLASGRGNAILVAGSIYEACKYYELFQKTDLKDKCAIITSYNPQINNIKGFSSEVDGNNKEKEKYDIYTQMLNGKNIEVFEKEVKEKFKKQPSNMKLLIVVNKLLTGFDAPSATYLYLDKSMRDQDLFQAICRVNRTSDSEKEYGYIVDYVDLFKNLENAVKTYTNGAFDSFEPEDVTGLVSDRIEKIREKLDETFEQIEALCEPVKPPKGTMEFIHYFVTENSGNIEEIKKNEYKRQMLYKYTTSFIRAYAEAANDMEKCGYNENEIKKFEIKAKNYEAIRKEVMLAAGEFIDLRQYDNAMRYLFDTYIKASDSEKISSFEDYTLIDLIAKNEIEAIDALPEGIKSDKKSVAETIENNTRVFISENIQTNPKYYEKMSTLLEELIKKRKNDTYNYEKYLKEMVNLISQMHKQSDITYPTSIDTKGKKALYDNLGYDENLTLELSEKLKENSPHGWLGSKMKEKKIKQIIENYITDEKQSKIIFDIIKTQGEYTG